MILNYPDIEENTKLKISIPYVEPSFIFSLGLVTIWHVQKLMGHTRIEKEFLFLFVFFANNNGKTKPFLFYTYYFISLKA